ncbi:MAG: hypothetical protein IJI51_05605 [Lachnospiraceae bacterium]|nr:hypothetical protein [Lachnospiraceae bacterium]
MTSKNLIDACDILLKLEQEFASEEAKLSDVSNEHAMKIDELDQQITTFRRNEDVDFRVFSPRNLSTVTSDKIKSLEEDKKQLEREKKEADKQLRYYSGKTEMISRVLELLRSGLKEESDEDSSTVRNSKNPFSFLDEDQDSVVEFEDETDDIAALFAPVRSEEETVSEKESSTEKSADRNEVSFVESVGVPVDEVERVCHKVEFCEKIISNDGIRAKLEIKNIVADLKELIRAYSS